MKLIKELRYYEEIDFIKALAILIIVIQHSMSSPQEQRIFGEYWLYQAIPVFMIIAGISASLAIRNGARIGTRLKRILLPYSLAWVVWFVFVALPRGIHNIPKSYLFGSWGVGTYFVPLFTQHVVIFPLFFLLATKLEKKISPNKLLITFFIASVFLDLLCTAFIMPSNVYAILYIRHLYAVFLGIYLVRHKISLKLLFSLALLGFGYMILVCEFPQPYILYLQNRWCGQQAPGYFYTLILVVGLWKLYPLIRPLAKHLNFIGKASYHIFLIQAFYFLWARPGVGNIIINLIICLYLGCLFYKNQPRIEKFLRIR